MKVHPAPNHRNITVRYDNAAVINRRQKKLRRLPHIFTKVLELPFYSDADVSVHETSDSLRFVIGTDDDVIGGEIGARAIEICSGVTKVVVGEPVDEVEVDVWRFRLPDCTVPELATASFSDGELVVVVPKDGELDGDLLFVV
ncbi:hypothetical protein Hdeb2414_s0006g00190751 [Helianthus debilis subsp. tardiflorus]